MKRVALVLVFVLSVAYMLKSPGPMARTLSLAAHDGWYFVWGSQEET